MTIDEDVITDAPETRDDTTPDTNASDARRDVPWFDSGQVTADATDVADTEDDSEVFFDPDLGLTDTVDAVSPSDVVVFSLDPALGTTEGGTSLLIFGDSFTVDVEVLINGRRAENLDYIDDETLLAVTPPNPAGVYDVKFVQRGGETTLEDGFRYVAPLTVSQVSPAEGPLRGGVPVVVFGDGFSDDARVSFGGRSGIETRVISGSEIETVAPPGVEGPSDVRVSGTTGSALLADGFTYYADATLSAVDPGVAPPSGGTEVAIRGSGLSAVEQVWFGASEGNISSARDDEVRAVVPPGAGVVDVRVMTARGGDTLVGGLRYLELDGDLRLDSVFPTSGEVGGGYRATLTGPQLGDVLSVRWGGIEASILSQGYGWCVVSVPPGLGVVDVDVATATEVATLNEAFTYLPVLAIHNVGPAAGPVEGGTVVTVAGEGFSAETRLFFGPVPAATTYVSEGVLSAVSPPGSIGPVTIWARDDEREASLVDAFAYTEPLVFAGMAPTRGAISGGTYVELQGQGFTSDATVYFDDVEAAEVAWLDGGTLAVRTPAHAPGPAAVRVEADGATSSTRSFVFYDPYTPAGGWWGDPIDGSVNVTVENLMTAARIPDAYVTLHIRATDSAHVCQTNVNGQCVISGPGVSGVQTVTASAEGFSSATITSVDAENLVISLSEQVDPSMGEPPVTTFPVLEGTLVGLDKLVDPAAGEEIIGVIRTTTPGVGASNPEGTGFTSVFWNGGTTPMPFSMFSRQGLVAVVAMCGIYNAGAGTFEPLYMGVERNVLMRGTGTVSVELDCDIHLSETLVFKFRNPPLTAGGAEINEAVAYLDFGQEGAIDFMHSALGTEAILTDDHYAPLDEPELDGVHYDVTGQSRPEAGGVPFSTVYARDILTTSERIDFPESMPPAQILYPPASRELVERRFEWRLPTDARPDFYYAYIEVPGLIPFRAWEVWLPGDVTSFNLPYFPEGSGASVLPNGALFFVVFAVDAYTFDYARFDNNDFSGGNWASYSAHGHIFLNTD